MVIAVNRSPLLAYSLASALNRTSPFYSRRIISAATLSDISLSLLNTDCNINIIKITLNCPHYCVPIRLLRYISFYRMEFSPTLRINYVLIALQIPSNSGQLGDFIDEVPVFSLSDSLTAETFISFCTISWLD